MGAGTAAFVAFVVSGFLHEMAISYPAGAGWGLPLVYFFVQAVAYAVEQGFFPETEGDDWSLLRGAWSRAVVLVPVPLLFHGPFRLTFVVPVIEAVRPLIVQYSVLDCLAAGLWVGAAGHLLVLGASYQVPDELEWKEDLESLKPLNRNLIWTYGGFIVLTIVSFGVLTAVFHGEFVSGSPVALGLRVFIAAFWTARILVDSFYFSHDDWPEGVKYVVGHTMVTSLFLLLVGIYAGVVVFHTLLSQVSSETACCQKSEEASKPPQKARPATVTKFVPSDAPSPNERATSTPKRAVRTGESLSTASSVLGFMPT